MTLKNILIAASFSFVPLAGFAFQGADNKNDVKIPDNRLTIHEDHFACFRSLECLKKENPFKNSNLDNINLNGKFAEKFIIEGTSKNEDIYAVYNKNGDLISATVVQRNIRLPIAISEVLVNGKFKDWTMIANELVVKNFDEDKMTFQVVLNREGEIRVEHFDRFGNLKNRFL